MLLYENEMSGNCYKVRLVLARLGIDYESRSLSVEDRQRRRLTGRGNSLPRMVPAPGAS